MFINRQSFEQLEQWKARENRKPLVIRGARQVGKTTLVNFFSKTYQNYIALNLEKVVDRNYFTSYTNVTDIVDALFLSNNITTDQYSNTLLFIDEIQESPEAINSLRYFFEDIPELHVIAAGSLLEHAMQEVKSFPVGRIEYLYLFPLNFQEFLEAKGHDLALEQFQKIPIPFVAHQILLDLFHEYTIVGGMPEIVQQYLIQEKISGLTHLYESIWASYKDDVEKYASNATQARVIKHVINTAHLYIDQRIKFEGFGQSNYRSREVGEAIRNLNDARIVQLIYPTTDTSIPIKPNLKKSPRLQFLDTGLLNHELNIQAQLMGMKDLSNAYKGAIIPHLLTQEILSTNRYSYHKPCFWIRKKKQSSSEVDLVLSYGDKVIPIEIKAGKTGTLRSLHQFIEMVDHPYAVRIYGGVFSIEQHKTPRNQKDYLLMNLPYYLGTKIHDYLRHFVENFQLPLQ